MQTCEMYPGGTWMGGIDPLGDIMGTSAGPAGEDKSYLLRGTFSFTFVHQQHTWQDTNSHKHTQRKYCDTYVARDVMQQSTFTHV